MRFVLAIFLAAVCGLSNGLVVRTPATTANFQKYRSQLPADFNIVEYGGWYKLEQEATRQLAATNFAALKPNLPATSTPNFNVVEAGGWNALQQHAADPKGYLIEMIKHPDNKANSSYNLQAIVALLNAMGKGFESDLVDGEWTLLMERQGAKSPTFQKLVGAAEKKSGGSSADFNVKALEFNGKATGLLKYGVLCSTVKYRPVADNFEKSGKSIILRRISCDIVGASWKYGRLPRLPLPLRVKGGYLDFLYLDGDIRVTKGNRGGIFVHGRPSFVQEAIMS